MLNRIIAWGNRFINYRMGFIAASIMGLIVFVINYDHGLGPAAIAGIKQGAYTFLFGGLVIKACQTLALKLNPKILAIAMAIIIPSLITTTAVLMVHHAKGTPKPWASTIPTIILSPPGFAYIGIKKRLKPESII